MSTAAGAAPDLSRTAGPLLIGYLVNWGLFGVLSVQVYLYYLAFPKDQMSTKALVYGDYILEATQTFLLTTSAFRSFATGFGNPEVLNNVDILWFSVPILSGKAAFVAQAFYAYRISVLSQKKYVAAIVMLFLLIQLGGAFTISAQVKQAKLFTNFLKKNSFIALGVWQGGSAACDVIIAISMTYYLRSRDSGVMETHVLITRVIRLIVETGTLTATIAIVTLILNYLPGQPTYYQASVGALGKVYSNSMMVVFNSRMRVASVNSTSTSNEVPIPLSHVNRMTSDNGQSRMHGGILVTREEISFSGDRFMPGVGDKKRGPDDFESDGSEFNINRTSKPQL
ncbi:hypothetical protein BDZ97DRAFT_182300 [Flammula alnicola]|nr:hypothetical protein BDZ97DRAFT_182300 [Flammula alnicola]